MDTSLRILTRIETINFIVSNRERIEIAISDYSNVVPYKEKPEKLNAELDKAGIRHYIIQEMVWRDLEFPKSKNKVSDNEAVQVYKGCGMHCRTLYDLKLWHCSYESSAYRAGIMEANENQDYIDLKKCNKKELLEFYWGYSTKGYDSLCRYCHPYGKIIPAGIKMPKIG